MLEYDVVAKRIDAISTCLHQNVRKYGTISNTVAAATEHEGVIKRKI